MKKSQLNELFGLGKGASPLKADKYTMEALAAVLSAAIKSGLSPKLGNWAGMFRDNVQAAAESGKGTSIPAFHGVRDWDGAIPAGTGPKAVARQGDNEKGPNSIPPDAARDIRSTLPAAWQTDDTQMPGPGNTSVQAPAGDNKSKWSDDNMKKSAAWSDAKIQKFLSDRDAEDEKDPTGSERAAPKSAANWKPSAAKTDAPKKKKPVDNAVVANLSKPIGPPPQRKKAQ